MTVQQIIDRIPAMRVQEAFDIASDMTGFEVLSVLTEMGVPLYHIEGIQRSNDVTLGRALFVYKVMESKQ